MTLIPTQLNLANLHVDTWLDSGDFRSVSVEIGNKEGPLHNYHGGVTNAEGTTPVTGDSLFLIASPTKPVTALAVMQLVERGTIKLSDHVRRYLPNMRGEGREDIRIVHCLTHTSGLPDMVSANTQLRKDKRPLADFLNDVYNAPLLFPAGTDISYQSMGLLLVAAVVEVTTGQALPDYLRDEVFQPLGISDTALGIPDSWYTAANDDEQLARLTDMYIPETPESINWGWNSRYWRQLGAPWGGLISTAPDLGRLYSHLLQVHSGQAGVLQPRTLTAMTTNQLTSLSGISRRKAMATPWAYGWQPNWPNHPRGLGSLVPATAYGHWGITGTLVWIDPQSEHYCVILTSSPVGMENRPQIALSNILASAIPADR